MESEEDETYFFQQNHEILLQKLQVLMSWKTDSCESMLITLKEIEKATTNFDLVDEVRQFFGSSLSPGAIPRSLRPSALRAIPRAPSARGTPAQVRFPSLTPISFLLKKKTRFKEEETGWVANGVPLKSGESRRRDGSGGDGDPAPNGRWVRCRVAPEVIPVATAPARSSRGGFGLLPTSPPLSPARLDRRREPRPHSPHCTCDPGESCGCLPTPLPVSPSRIPPTLALLPLVYQDARTPNLLPAAPLAGDGRALWAFRIRLDPTGAPTASHGPDRAAARVQTKMRKRMESVAVSYFASTLTAVLCCTLLPVRATATVSEWLLNWKTNIDVHDRWGSTWRSCAEKTNLAGQLLAERCCCSDLGRYGLNVEEAEWIIYMTNVGQQHHFDMFFSAARMATWLPNPTERIDQSLLNLLQFTFSISVQLVSFLLPWLFYSFLSCVYQLMFRGHLHCNKLQE
ncbi:uncharacterized protein [Miscanthus floridulus]|uniref:uncharacterized protein n=1 Tax=Miscanthus floridulus TaxID=154761 RepID=UPI003459C488